MCGTNTPLLPGQHTCGQCKWMDVGTAVCDSPHGPVASVSGTRNIHLSDAFEMNGLLEKKQEKDLLPTRSISFLKLLKHFSCNHTKNAPFSSLGKYILKLHRIISNH